MFKIFLILCVSMISIDALPATAKQNVYPKFRQVLPVRYPFPKFTGLAPYPPSLQVSQVVLNRQLEVLYKSFVDTMNLELLLEKIAEHLDLTAVQEAMGNITLQELFTAFKPALEAITSIWHHIGHYWDILCKKTPAPPMEPPMEPSHEHGAHEEHEHGGEHHEEDIQEHVEEHDEPINHHEHVNHHEQSIQIEPVNYHVQGNHHNAHKDHDKKDKDHKEHQADNKPPAHEEHKYTEIFYANTGSNEDQTIKKHDSNYKYIASNSEKEAAIGKSWYQPNADFPWKME